MVSKPDGNWPQITVIGICGIPEVQENDDLTAIILKAISNQGVLLERGDIVVVTQKIISKAEGRTVDLIDIEPSPFALTIGRNTGSDPRHIEIVLRESRRIVRMDRGIIIAETFHGFICANAGVDASNVPGESCVTLLPHDSDKSADEIREKLEKHTGFPVSVIVSDTFGRPWREGTTNVAIGVSGISPLKDYRGTEDEHGYELKVSVAAWADEIAGCADLVLGKTDGIPVALVRGIDYTPCMASISLLLRPPEIDMFR